MSWIPRSAIGLGPGATDKVIEVDESDCSLAMTLRGQANCRRNLEALREIPTEAVASRTLWGFGYHLPAVYYRGECSEDGTKARIPSSRAGERS